MLRPATAENQPKDTLLTLQTLEDSRSVDQAGARRPVVDADAIYRSELEELQKSSQAAGDLKSVLAAKKAIEDLDAGRPPMVSDDEAVAAIQKIHKARRQKAEAESVKLLTKIDQVYLASLKRLVADLTKAGKIEDAVEVQAKVDGLVGAHHSTTALSNPGAGEVEVWKKKAMEEFPALKQPDSELAKSVKALTERKKVTDPEFFKNTQWPYLLAKEANSALNPTNLQDLLADTSWTTEDDGAFYRLFTFAGDGRITRVGKDGKVGGPTQYFVNEATNTVTFISVGGHKVVFKFSKDRKTFTYQSTEYRKLK